MIERTPARDECLDAAAEAYARWLKEQGGRDDG
jgi:hypothetical protein